jgi:hypothetical protein
MHDVRRSSAIDEELAGFPDYNWVFRGVMQHRVPAEWEAVPDLAYAAPLQ